MKKNGDKFSQSKIKSIIYRWVLNSSPKFIIENTLLRRFFSKLIELYFYQALLRNKNFPRQVQLDKFFMYRSLTRALNKLLNEVKRNPAYRQTIINSVLPQILSEMEKSFKSAENFNKQYGFNPPGFLTISPGKFCNLKCVGCYASSSSASQEKLDWDIVDKIVEEKTNSWGSWFTVISRRGAVALGE